MDISKKQLDFCLLIPCYNNLKGLIDSIKTVSYEAEKFCIVIVDDGSKEPIIATTIQEQTNIQCALTVLRSSTNSGIADALNKGLDWISESVTAKYIARLDCGDVCDSSRFYKQVNYLDNHPGTSLLGTWCIFENKSTSFRYRYRTPTSHNRIKIAMHFRNLFIHPTLMFRRGLLKEIGNYPTNFTYAEDYAFCWKLLKVGDGHILSDFLVTCEINSAGISLRNRRKQLTARKKVIDELGTGYLLKILGLIRLKVLNILPEPLILRMKKLAGE